VLRVRRRLLAEAVGTFALVFAGTGAIVINDVSGGAVTHVGVALTFGLVVMAMIYALGDISGAHLNPAVTLGFVLSGRMRPGAAGPYAAAQLAGAAAASALLLALFPGHETLGATSPMKGTGVWPSFVLEVVLTAGLMLVILMVSTGPKETGLMAGIAVGGTVGLEALFAGPICGASMNPARSLAPAVVSGRVGEVWIYVAAPLVGAVVAVALARGLRPREAAEGRG